MEASVVSNRSIIGARRWDFEYFDPEYAHVIDLINASRWPVKRLNEIVSNLTDGQHGYLVHLSSGIPLLRTSNVFENEIRLEDVRYIAPEVHAEIKRSQLRPGDVLLTTIGTIGMAAVVDESLGEANINQNLVKMTPKSEVDPWYLAIFFNSQIGRVQIDRTASRSVVPIVNYARLRDVLVPLPPLDVQGRIAQVIQDTYATRQSKVSDAKSLTDGVNEFVLGQLGIDLASVIQQKTFLAKLSELSGGKWRVENHNLRSLYQALSDGLYALIHLRDVAITVQERAKLPEKFRYIEIGDIEPNYGEIAISALQVHNSSSAPNNAQRQVRTGDILISTRRPTRGAIAVVPPALDGEICTVFFSIVRERSSEKVLPQFVSNFLRTPAGIMQLQRAITATTYPVISDADVENLLIPLPPMPIQQQISEEVSQRLSRAAKLRSEALASIIDAKARVERMILGEDGVV